MPEPVGRVAGDTVNPVEETERFADLLRSPDRSLPLDEVCFLIAAHFTSGLDVDGQLQRLDDLAEGVTTPTLDELREHLFGRLAFHGNVDRYADPENSYLNRVIDRRTGIPITLSVLTMEVGRRVGVELVGIGMPGHFLLRDARDDTVFVDPFSGGVVLNPTATREVFLHLHGQTAPFDEAYLDPTPRVAIVARVLGNLRNVFATEGDPYRLATVLQLRTAVPGVPPMERRELAQAYAALGRFTEAAAELESLAGLTTADEAERLLSTARQLRAKLN
jgi:regulator of sirC expression with transglutaminase-like and TPR domain